MFGPGGSKANRSGPALGSFLFELDDERHENSEPDIGNELNVEGGLSFMPPKMLFTNPFEGKRFQETLLIRNVGKRPIFIRILSPSASGIHIQTIKDGRLLCSGMYIKRVIRYKVQMMTLVKSCIIPIYVNDDTVINYEVKIFDTPMRLEIEPINVDFGQVDVSPTPIKRAVKLSNPDIKPLRYFIDLGPNMLNLSVDPLRGLIMGESSVTIDLSLILMHEGTFETEFWIMTPEYPSCVHLKVEVGIPRLEPLHLTSMKSFTFVHFPTTYYGAVSSRTVAILNNSMNQSFFCVLGEIDMRTYAIKEAIELDPTYKNFKIYPEEGRLLANDVRLFQLVHAPVKNDNLTDSHYHLVVIRIRRLYVKDLDVEQYANNLFSDEAEGRSWRVTGSESTVSTLLAGMDDAHLSKQEELDLRRSGEESLDMQEDMSPYEIRLMLYGEVEDVNVTIIPHEIILLDVHVNERITRVLQIQNNCNTLPIIYRYKKIAFVEIEPCVGEVKPSESVEVLVVIKPRSFDKVSTQIVFDLLYQDHEEDDAKCFAVGQISLKFVMQALITAVTKAVTTFDHLLARNFDFKKPIVKPNAMVMSKLLHGQTYLALPDDRLPIHNPLIRKRTFKTIYAAIPRYQKIFTPYALTSRDKDLRAAKNYYDIYIKSGKQKGKSTELVKVPSSKCVNYKNKQMVSKKTIINEIEFIPLMPLQLHCIEVTPRNSLLENVAFNSTHSHTLLISNKNDVPLNIFLRARHPSDYYFDNGTRGIIPAFSEKEFSYKIIIDASPLHNYELDVLINNCFVIETSILVKAKPRHLTLSINMLTFYEKEAPNKFVELHNELNVDIPFQWKFPSVFRVDPVEGEVVSGRFVACMISFEIGLAENMVYNLGVHTENKFYNLKVLIEGTDYNVKLPKSIAFGQLSYSIPVTRSLPLTNLSPQEVNFEVVDASKSEMLKVRPATGKISPMGVVYLSVTVNRTQIGDFSKKIEIIIAHRQKNYCELCGTVIFPQLTFRPESIRFRKMSASSFDIACVTIINTSPVPAMIQFDTQRFSELNYSEYTNSDFLTDKDVIYIKEYEEKQISIHFYPYNPLVTSFPLPINVNTIGANSPKSKTCCFFTKPIVKIHAQVLSSKLEVKSWRYMFKYFPYFDYKCVTTQELEIRNPTKIVITFCIRLDELTPPYALKWKEGGIITHHDYSYVVELQPDQGVIFEATYTPEKAGNHTIRLPVYIKDDLTNDMHNYFYFVGEYPRATYGFSDTGVYLGFVPLYFTITKKITVTMDYHSPECNCIVTITDPFCYIEVDTWKPRKVSSTKSINIVFTAHKQHMLKAKLRLKCSCPGPDLEIEVYGGSEYNIFTVHACIQYFKYSRSMCMNSIFEPDEELHSFSTITIQDPDREELIKHNFVTDLPFFQSGQDVFSDYMNRVVKVFEAYLREQVFFHTKSFTIPDTICRPDIKLFEKGGRRDGIIKYPLLMILNYLLGSQCTSQFDVRFSEKKAIWFCIRKFYKDVLAYLLNMNCFVAMIKPEDLMPYEMYQEYMIAIDQKGKTLSFNQFYLLSKQSWLDLLMQCYKSLVFNRIRQYPVNLSTGAKSITSGSYSLSPRPSPGTIASVMNQVGQTLMMWLDKHYQEQKIKFASAKYGNHMTADFHLEHITNFDLDLSDSLAIIAVLIAYCPFLEEMIMGIYAPATNRMEKFNNAYILLKLLDSLNVSFHLKPNDIIEPNTIQMIMFVTYLFEFIMPLKNKETIQFSVDLSQTREESIEIVNQNRHKMYYNIFFFNNLDNLFSVPATSIIVEQDGQYELKISYCARFLRVQKTVLLLSGEIPGYQYTTSKIYYLEGHPDLNNVGEVIKVPSKIYQIGNAHLDFTSPYKVACEYNIYYAAEQIPNVNKLLETLISYDYILKTQTLTRLKFNTATVTADETGHIAISCKVCSIIDTKGIYWLVLRHETIGDFILKLQITVQPMKKYNLIRISLSKHITEFPCICSNMKPDVFNSKCPRNIKILIPNRNSYLWSAVMKYFLSGRDEDEADFWVKYGKTSIGSYIVKRILNDHKKFLSADMNYFMSKQFSYNVSTKQKNLITTQRKKVIKEEPGVDARTEILVHVNGAVRLFHLTLNSVDKKETRIFKVAVNYT